MRVLALGDNVFDSYDNLGVMYPGGNAVNVAVNAVRLEHDSAYVGLVADDVLGRYCLSALAAEGVDVSHCKLVAGTTTKVCHEVMEGNDRRYLFSETGESWVGNLVLDDDMVAFAQGFDLVFTSCNAKCEDELPKLAGCAAPLVFDFGEKDKYRTDEYLGKVLPHVSLALFSMSGSSVGEVVALSQRLGGVPVLATRGTDLPVFCVDGTTVLGCASENTAVDAMGAGDAFVTAFATKLFGSGLPMADVAGEALGAAAAHAARMCQEHGAFGHELRLAKPCLVMFDMDGVLVETEPFYLQIHKDLLADYGMELDPEDERRMYGISDPEDAKLMQRYLGGTVEEVMTQMKEAFKDRPVHYPDVLIDGVPELLEYLNQQGIVCALASSSPQRDIDRMLDECSLSDKFALAISGEHFAESKPNPAIYLHLLEQLNVALEDAFIVEDSNYGIMAGVAAGVRVLALKKEHTNADHVACETALDNHGQTLDFFKYVCERSNTC